MEDIRLRKRKSKQVSNEPKLSKKVKNNIEYLSTIYNKTNILNQAMV